MNLTWFMAKFKNDLEIDPWDKTLGFDLSNPHHVGVINVVRQP